MSKRLWRWLRGFDIIDERTCLPYGWERVADLPFEAYYDRYRHRLHVRSINVSSIGEGDA